MFNGWAALLGIATGFIILGAWLFIRWFVRRERWPRFGQAERMLFSVPVVRLGKNGYPAKAGI